MRKISFCAIFKNHTDFLSLCAASADTLTDIAPSGNEIQTELGCEDYYMTATLPVGMPSLEIYPEYGTLFNTAE